MTYEIKSRYDGRVLYTADAELLRQAVEIAVEAKANLRGADLRNADLRYADLRGADLRNADLRGADLHEADLRGADLHNADLSGANLRGAYLSGAVGVPGFATPEESTQRLDQIREIVLADNERLRMNGWHHGDWKPEEIPETPGGCGMAHCLGGWAQALSTDMEMRKLPVELAAVRLIPTAIHMFYESDERALEFLLNREYANEPAP